MALDLWLLGWAQPREEDGPPEPLGDGEPPWLFDRAWDVWTDMWENER